MLDVFFLNLKTSGKLDGRVSVIPHVEKFNQSGGAKKALKRGGFE
jgi:hypothetical protein